jgi:hypothetical protein
MSEMFQLIDQGALTALCPELREILDAELAAGNEVVSGFCGTSHRFADSRGP